jgi:hypothetical protein
MAKCSDRQIVHSFLDVGGEPHLNCHHRNMRQLGYINIQFWRVWGPLLCVTEDEIELNKEYTGCKMCVSVRHFTQKYKSYLRFSIAQLLPQHP